MEDSSEGPTSLPLATQSNRKRPGRFSTTQNLSVESTHRDSEQIDGDDGAAVGEPPVKRPKCNTLANFLGRQEPLKATTTQQQQPMKVSSYAESGIDEKETPISKVKDMFVDIVENATSKRIGLEACAKYFNGAPINIATMCSGTEAPILALMMIFEAMREKDPALAMSFNHIFSAEIVAYKQHYIETNFAPPILFSDITELTKELPSGQTTRTLTTAYGGQAIVPGGVDLLVAGFSCVDFSSLNGNKKVLEERGESGDTFFSMREYAKVYRPRVIILENVLNAPWDHLKEQERFKKKQAQKKKKESAKNTTKEADTVNNSEQMNTSKKDNKVKDESKGSQSTEIQPDVSQSNEDGSDEDKPRTGLDYLMGEVGYATKYVIVDTKDYYLPQTRQRGYMVCIDRMSYLEEKVSTDTFFSGWEAKPLVNKCGDHQLLGIDTDLNKWKSIMVEKLKRPASVPAEMLFLRSDDPALEALSRMDDHISTRKATAWDTCRIGYNNYREIESLGKKRELTEWVNGGAFVAEDFWKRHTKGIGERVLDTLDVAHLRNLRRGLDDRYANRIIELSQNVYRVTDTVKSGIIGCLTPTGMPYLTTRGGRIIGHEALIMQGLGLEELELNMMSQANLQDLAGNAMTSTVVGAAITAALSVFYNKFEVDHKGSRPEPRGIALELSGEDTLSENVKFSHRYDNTLSPARAIEEACLTRRLCACEGRMHSKNAAFQRCKICSHTTCKKCGVKPKHQYGDIASEHIQKRKIPSCFENLIKRSIPASISFRVSSAEVEQPLDRYYRDFADGPNFVKTIKDALNSEVYLRDIRRDEYWEINYDSPTARLLLTISEDKVEWRLYANVEQEGLKTAKGMFFRRFPIAKMQPGHDDINIGSWLLWLPGKHEFAANLTWTGNLVKNFANQRGLPEMETEYVYPTCELEIPGDGHQYFEHDLQGHYNLHQECGQPHNTLHAREPHRHEKPLFFYLEQHLRTGNPDPTSGHHYFVFTQDTHRLEKIEHRNIIASFETKWRPPIVKVKTKEYPETDYRNFKHLKYLDDVQYIDNLQDAQGSYLQKAKICVDGRWSSLPGLSMNVQTGTKLTYRFLPPDLGTLPFLDDSCNSSARAALSLEAALTGKIAGSWIRGLWIEITRANESGFMKEFGWALAPGRVLDGHTQGINTWHLVATNRDRCFACAPLPPRLQWSMNKKGKAEPSEEPLAATEYEKSLKNRSPAFTAKFRLSDIDHLSLKVGVNPRTLIHRAVALLPLLPEAEELGSQVLTYWRLVTDDVTSPNADLCPLKVSDNKDRSGQVEVKGFKLSLRIEQLRALDWAIERDKGETVFSEEEIVEARLKGLAYRLEGKATRDVKRRGGLLFFDVGFGKTAVTLALTQNRLEVDKQAAENLMKMDLPSKGKIPLKGTVIFVPDHLPEQWYSEVGKFLGKSGSKVLLIKSMTSLKSKTIEDFQGAELVIICWNFLENQSYHERLADLAGIVDRDDKGTQRSKSEWYMKASSKILTTVKHLYTDGTKPTEVWSRLLDEYETDNIASSQKNVPVPTKRQRGKAYVASKKKKLGESHQDGNENHDSTNDAERKRTPNAYNFANITKVENMRCPLLEMFSFARLIIDEYTYLLRSPLALLMVKNISASSKFVLSGTPILASFADVKELASILGIHLGIKDYSTMKTDVFKQATHDLSRSELFLTYKTAESVAWHVQRQAVAQRFLDMFARKDAADVGNIKVLEHYHLVDLDPAHKAVYLELEQRVASSTFENLRSKSVDSETERLIQQAICASDDSREALLLRASHLKLAQNVIDKNEGKTDGSKKEVKTKRGKDVEVESPPPINTTTMISTRLEQYDKLLECEASLLKKAFWLQNHRDSEGCENFQAWIRRMNKKNGYHDEETRKDLLKLIQQAEENYDEADWKLFYCKYSEASEEQKEKAHLKGLLEFPDGYNTNTNTSHLMKVVAHLRATTVRLNKLGEVIVNHNRSLRFVRAIKNIQDGSAPCSSCGEFLSNPQDAALLSACGHTLCPRCLKGVVDGDDCPLPGCDLSMKEIQKFNGHELCHGSRSGITTYGHKVDDIVSLVKRARAVGDKVLIFAQFPSFSRALKTALEAEVVGYDKNLQPIVLKVTDLTVKADKSSKLSKFQNSDSDVDVLLLDPSDSSASGANLTCTNHVIFAHPLHTQGLGAQAKYTDTITQAIGRARRYGQLKKVHVHYFLSVKTIDIDLFEHRSGMVVQRNSQFRGYGVVVNKVPGVVESTLSSRIAHINYPDDAMTD